MRLRKGRCWLPVEDVAVALVSFEQKQLEQTRRALLDQENALADIFISYSRADRESMQ